MATQRRQGPRASPWRRLPPFRPAGARRRRLTPDTVGCHELADPMCPHWGWRGDARVPVEPLAAGRAGLGAPGGRSACCRPPASRRRSRTRRRDGVSKGITPLQRSWALPPGIDVHGSDPTGGGVACAHTRRPRARTGPSKRGTPHHLSRRGGGGMPAGVAHSTGIHPCRKAGEPISEPSHSSRNFTSQNQQYLNDTREIDGFKLASYWEQFWSDRPPAVQTPCVGAGWAGRSWGTPGRGWWARSPG